MRCLTALLVWCSVLDRIIHSFIHSGHFYSAPSSPLLLLRGAQAIAGKGLAQDPYVAARAGVEPTTHRLKVINSTKAPLRSTNRSLYGHFGWSLGKSAQCHR